MPTPMEDFKTTAARYMNSMNWESTLRNSKNYGGPSYDDNQIATIGKLIDEMKAKKLAGSGSGSAGGKYGGYGSAAEQLKAEMDKKLAEANAANEARYQDILGQKGQMYDRTMANLSGLGAQEEADIRQNYANLDARTAQDMQARGLAGTTIGASLRKGNARATNEELNRMRERLTRERIGYDTNLSMDKQNFMERKTDLGPDIGMYAQLMQQLGQGSTGGTRYVTRTSGYDPRTASATAKVSVRPQQYQQQQYAPQIQQVQKKPTTTTTKKTTTNRPAQNWGYIIGSQGTYSIDGANGAREGLPLTGPNSVTNPAASFLYNEAVKRQSDLDKRLQASLSQYF